MHSKKSNSENRSQKKNKTFEKTKSNTEYSPNKTSVWNSIPLSSKKKSSEQNASNSPSSPINQSFPFNKNQKFSNDNSKKKISDREQMKKDSEAIVNLKNEIESIKSNYKSEIDMILRENNSLQNQISQTKTELIDLLQKQNYSLKNCLNQLDVGFRVLSKVVRDTKEHYLKFVPLVLENVVKMIKKQEYLCEQIKDIQRFVLISPNESLNSNFYNSLTPDSKAYSISISSTLNKDLYKLIFNPISNINIAKFCQDAKECIYSLEEIDKTTLNLISSSSENDCNCSLSNFKSQTNLKVVETNEKINEKSNESIQRKFRFNNSLIESINYNELDFKSEFDLQLLNNLSTSGIIFKDLKNRYLSWKYHDFKSNTFPNLKCLNNDEEQLDQIDSDFSYEKENKSSYFNESLCQSDTELLGNRFFFISENDLPLEIEENLNTNQTLIYQTFTPSVIGELRKLDKTESYQNENNYDKNNEEFSIVLPRSRLSAILSNNFKNLSPLINLNEYEDTPVSYKIPIKSNISPQNLQNPPSSIIPMASFESLSDNENYMDDDYGQQFLLSQSYDENNIENFYNNSYENLCAKLENYQLPESSINNVFKNM